jgi:hypothetical protein
VRVRARARGAETVSAAVKLASAGSETLYTAALHPDRPLDVVVAVYRSTQDVVRVEVHDASTVVDPGPPARQVLVVGPLERAERACDALGISLRDVVRVDALPSLVDPAALDGFAGVVRDGVPSSARLAYAHAGGTLIDLDGAAPTPLPGLRAPRAAAEAAARLDARGLRARDAFGLAAGPILVALALTAAAAASALILTRSPVVHAAAVGAVALAALYWVAFAQGSLEGGARPRIEVRFSPTRALAFTPPHGGDPPWDAGIPYPCGPRAAIHRRIGFGSQHVLGHTWSSPSAVLVAKAAPPDAGFEGAPIDARTPESQTRNLRALIAGASEILGEGASSALDSARGILRIVPQASR